MAAGSVVTSDVNEGTIVGGVPAKKIGYVQDLVEKLIEQTAKLPWNELIQRRKGSFDPLMEIELKKMRMKYFFD